jgi:hypothetical protein
VNNDRDGSLENPPDGGKVRLPDAQAKPWEALGISRATWYRQGKPANVDRLASNEFHVRQKSWMGSYWCSARTIQRMFFVRRRYGIECMWQLAYQECLPLGMLEEIAKWEHEDQRRFIARLLELAPGLPWDKHFTDSEAYYIEFFGPVFGVLAPIDRGQLTRVARQVRREIEADMFS